MANGAMAHDRGGCSLAPCWDHNPSAQFWWDPDPGAKKPAGIGQDRGKNTWIPARIPATKDRQNTVKLRFIMPVDLQPSHLRNYINDLPDQDRLPHRHLGVHCDVSAQVHRRLMAPNLL